MFIISIDLVFLAYYGVGSSEDYIYIDLLSTPLTEIQTEDRRRRILQSV